MNSKTFPEKICPGDVKGLQICRCTDCKIIKLQNAREQIQSSEEGTEGDEKPKTNTESQPASQLTDFDVKDFEEAKYNIPEFETELDNNELIERRKAKSSSFRFRSLLAKNELKRHRKMKSSIVDSGSHINALDSKGRRKTKSIVSESKSSVLKSKSKSFKSKLKSPDLKSIGKKALESISKIQVSKTNSLNGEKNSKTQKYNAKESSNLDIKDVGSKSKDVGSKSKDVKKKLNQINVKSKSNLKPGSSTSESRPEIQKSKSSVYKLKSGLPRSDTGKSKSKLDTLGTKSDALKTEGTKKQNATTKSGHPITDSKFSSLRIDDSNSKSSIFSTMRSKIGSKFKSSLFDSKHNTISSKLSTAAYHLLDDCENLRSISEDLESKLETLKTELDTKTPKSSISGDIKSSIKSVSITTDSSKGKSRAESKASVYTSSSFLHQLKSDVEKLKVEVETKLKSHKICPAPCHTLEVCDDYIPDSKYSVPVLDNLKAKKKDSEYDEVIKNGFRRPDSELLPLETESKNIRIKDADKNKSVTNNLLLQSSSVQRNTIFCKAPCRNLDIDCTELKFGSKLKLNSLKTIPDSQESKSVAYIPKLSKDISLSSCTAPCHALEGEVKSGICKYDLTDKILESEHPKIFKSQLEHESKKVLSEVSATLDLHKGAEIPRQKQLIDYESVAEDKPELKPPGDYKMGSHDFTSDDSCDTYCGTMTKEELKARGIEPNYLIDSESKIPNQVLQSKTIQSSEKLPHYFKSEDSCDTSCGNYSVDQLKAQGTEYNVQPYSNSNIPNLLLPSKSAQHSEKASHHIKPEDPCDKFSRTSGEAEFKAQEIGPESIKKSGKIPRDIKSENSCDSLCGVLRQDELNAKEVKSSYPSRTNSKQRNIDFESKNVQSFGKMPRRIKSEDSCDTYCGTFPENELKVRDAEADYLPGSESTKRSTIHSKSDSGTDAPRDIKSENSCDTLCGTLSTGKSTRETVTSYSQVKKSQEDRSASDKEESEAQRSSNYLSNYELEMHSKVSECKDSEGTSKESYDTCMSTLDAEGKKARLSEIRNAHDSELPETSELSSKSFLISESRSNATIIAHKESRIMEFSIVKSRGFDSKNFDNDRSLHDEITSRNIQTLQPKLENLEYQSSATLKKSMRETYTPYDIISSSEHETLDMSQTTHRINSKYAINIQTSSLKLKSDSIEISKFDVESCNYEKKGNCYNQICNPSNKRESKYTLNLRFPNKKYKCSEIRIRCYKDKLRNPPCHTVKVDCLDASPCSSYSNSNTDDTEKSQVSSKLQLSSDEIKLSQSDVGKPQQNSAEQNIRQKTDGPGSEFSERKLNSAKDCRCPILTEEVIKRIQEEVLLRSKSNEKVCHCITFSGGTYKFKVNDPRVMANDTKQEETSDQKQGDYKPPSKKVASESFYIHSKLQGKTDVSKIQAQLVSLESEQQIEDSRDQSHSLNLELQNMKSKLDYSDKKSSTVVNESNRKLRAKSNVEQVETPTEGRKNESDVLQSKSCDLNSKSTEHSNSQIENSVSKPRPRYIEPRRKSTNNVRISEDNNKDEPQKNCNCLEKDCEKIFLDIARSKLDNLNSESLAKIFKMQPDSTNNEPRTATSRGIVGDSNSYIRKKSYESEHLLAASEPDVLSATVDDKDNNNNDKIEQLYEEEAQSACSCHVSNTSSNSKLGYSHLSSPEDNIKKSVDILEDTGDISILNVNSSSDFEALLSKLNSGLLDPKIENALKKRICESLVLMNNVSVPKQRDAVTESKSNTMDSNLNTTSGRQYIKGVDHDEVYNDSCECTKKDCKEYYAKSSKSKRLHQSEVTGHKSDPISKIKIDNDTCPCNSECKESYLTGFSSKNSDFNAEEDYPDLGAEVKVYNLAAAHKENFRASIDDRQSAKCYKKTFVTLCKCTKNDMYSKNVESMKLKSTYHPLMNYASRKQHHKKNNRFAGICKCADNLLKELYSIDIKPRMNDNETYPYGPGMKSINMKAKLNSLESKFKRKICKAVKDACGCNDCTNLHLDNVGSPYSSNSGSEDIDANFSEKYHLRPTISSFNSNVSSLRSESFELKSESLRLNSDDFQGNFDLTESEECLPVPELEQFGTKSCQISRSTQSFSDLKMNEFDSKLVNLRSEIAVQVAVEDIWKPENRLKINTANSKVNQQNLVTNISEDSLELKSSSFKPEVSALISELEDIKLKSKALQANSGSFKLGSSSDKLKPSELKIKSDALELLLDALKSKSDALESKLDDLKSKSELIESKLKETATCAVKESYKQWENDTRSTSSTQRDSVQLRSDRSSLLSKPGTLRSESDILKSKSEALLMQSNLLIKKSNELKSKSALLKLKSEALTSESKSLISNPSVIQAESRVQEKSENLPTGIDSLQSGSLLTLESASDRPVSKVVCFKLKTDGIELNKENNPNAYLWINNGNEKISIGSSKSNRSSILKTNSGILKTSAEINSNNSSLNKNDVPTVLICTENDYKRLPMDEVKPNIVKIKPEANKVKLDSFTTGVVNCKSNVQKSNASKGPNSDVSQDTNLKKIELLSSNSKSQIPLPAGSFINHVNTEKANLKTEFGSRQSTPDKQNRPKSPLIKGRASKSKIPIKL